MSEYRTAPVPDDSVERLRKKLIAAEFRLAHKAADVEARGGESAMTPKDVVQVQSFQRDVDQLRGRLSELGHPELIDRDADGEDSADRDTAGARALRDMPVNSRDMTPEAAVRNPGSLWNAPETRGVPSRIYGEDSRHSYLRDQVLATMGDAKAQLRQAQFADEARALNRTDGTGGNFVPPAWLMNQFIELARPGRVTASVVAQQALPSGTDSINIPKIVTGASTAIQTADNAAVSQTDPTDTGVQAPVRTIAGSVDVSYQLLEQSPEQFDQIIFRDLVADYAQRVDLQVLTGTGASGQMTGILNTGSIGAVTYSDTAQAIGTLYAAMANAVAVVQAGRFQSPTVIVMHPRRWAKILSSRDSQQRPLVVPTTNGLNNSMGVVSGLSDGKVGEMLGLPVYCDSNISTTVSTNQDVILVMKADDLVLWESGIRTRVYPVGGGTASTLTMRLELYGFTAFTAARYPASVCQITGAGLSTPTYN